MFFKRFQPGDGLEKFVECYWVIESDDHTPIKQKIIPDGFTELVFHYKDPYRIKIYKKWHRQSMGLLAGQVKKFFFLENTGASGVFGIKFKPAALTHLFGFSMDVFTDKVIAIKSLNNSLLKLLEQEIKPCVDYEEMIRVAEEKLHTIVKNIPPVNATIETIIDLIFKSSGAISIAEIQKEVFITERQLQRSFQKYIGLSPKFYTRIIRFNYIFQLMQEGKFTWLDITHRAGYFDQSHFIRDFRSFTGEDPSKYFFNEPNLANFFLKKK